MVDFSCCHKDDRHPPLLLEKDYWCKLNSHTLVTYFSGCLPPVPTSFLQTMKQVEAGKGLQENLLTVETRTPLLVVLDLGTGNSNPIPCRGV